MIGKKAVFSTKFSCDEKYNGETCKIIDYIEYRNEIMYLVEFKGKKRLKVYGNELTIINW